MEKDFYHQKKYLGVYLDENLSGESHCEELIKKLNRANGMLAKAKQFVPLNELKNVYHAIFPSHLMVAKFGHKSFSLLLTKCQFYKKML